MDRKILLILQELRDVDVDAPDICKPFTDETLAAYLDAELSGRDAKEFNPAFHAHLATCADCQQAYVEVKMLLQLEEAQAVALPTPNFDFSYLEQGAKAKKFVPEVEVVEKAARSNGYLDEVGRFIIRLSESLLANYQPARVANQLRAENANLLYEVSWQATDDLQVKIAIHRERHDHQLCNVQVEVNIPSRGGWPNLANIPVTLQDTSGPDAPTSVQGRQTDAFGKTLFQKVSRDALPNLTVMIDTGQASGRGRQSK